MAASSGFFDRRDSYTVLGAKNPKELISAAEAAGAQGDPEWAELLVDLASAWLDECFARTDR